MSTLVENLNTRRLRLLLAVLAVALAAAGCSFSKMGYDALPTLARWQINSYLDLDPNQRDIVDRHLNRLQQWHRHDQLPEYGGFLRAVDDRLRTPVDASQLRAWRGRVDQAWAAFAERLGPGVVELAPTLRPDQIARLRQRLAESNDKYRDTHLQADPKEREQARVERVVKRAEFFLGDLDEAQLRDLSTRARALPASDEAWFAERVARQQRMVALLERLRTEQLPRDEALRIVRDALATMWESRDPQRRLRIEQAVVASDALAASLVAQASPRQREFLSRRLRDYAQDFDVLSERTRTASR
jgi:hypothetical protein